MNRSRSAACRGYPRSRTLPPSGGALVSSAPADRRRTGEVAGLDLTVGYRMIQVDRDARAEQVAALVKGVAVTLGRHLERLAPVAQEHPVWLIGDQQVDVLGRQPDSIADGERHFGDLPIAAGQHLGDLGFGETDGEL